MQIGVGWVRVVGGLRCADRWWVGSVPISVFGGGADLGADLCFWRRLWVDWVGSGCGWVEMCRSVVGGFGADLCFWWWCRSLFLAAVVG